MSVPLYLQPPPAMALPEQPYTAASAGSSHAGSIGPFVAVLVVVMVLCILAGIAGRLCSGKTIMGYGEFDIERWAETKCSSCIDGRIPPPPPPPSAVQEAPPVQTHEEEESNEQEPESAQNTRGNGANVGS